MNLDNTVLERKEERCEQHGPFQRVRYARGWRGQCEPCWKIEVQKRAVEAEARRRAERISYLHSSSCLDRRFEGKGFGNYVPTTAAQRKALQACEAYGAHVAHRVQAGACLVLIGQHGLGKSHLLCALLKVVIGNECSGRYTTMSDFLAAVEGNWVWHGAERGREFLGPKVLVLDEVKAPETGRDRESLFALLDARYRAVRPTLIGTNLTWPQMREQLGERFCDRLLENGGQVLALDGKSARK
jgi:DNA replication protein DnaC